MASPVGRYTFDDRGGRPGLALALILAALVYAGWDCHQHGLRLPSLDPTGELKTPLPHLGAPSQPAAGPWK